MRRLRLALLNAAHEGENTARNFRRELDADLVEFDANAQDLPEHFDFDSDGGTSSSRTASPFDGVVITGSRSSVYWDEEWIPPLIEWTAEAAERGLPILGVCYGHQVLAEALGGRVHGMDDFEIGYNAVTHRDDELFEGIDEEFTVFTTHGDAVTELPPGAKLLAENEFGVHAFRRGRCWGVQFHPEYDVETAREVTEGKRERIGDDKVDRVLAGITAENSDAACEAKTLFDNFTAYCRRVREEREADASAEA